MTASKSKRPTKKAREARTPGSEALTSPRAAEKALRASEAELRRSQGRMRALVRGLLDLQEGERRRLARDLHDDLSQRAAALALEAAALANSAEWPRLELSSKLNSLAMRASGLCMELARLAHELHPVGLEKLGLVSALKSLTVEHSSRYGIEIHFTHRRLPPALPAEISLCLFRIVQEAFRNIARHPKASRAYITVAGAGDGIRLSIRDQGRGFDPNPDDGAAGLGLIGMKERVRLAGGTFSLDAQPGKGVRIEVRVPLLPSEAGGFTEAGQQ